MLKRKKDKLRISKYHVLVLSAIIFVVQYPIFSVHRINTPLWLYFILLSVALVGQLAYTFVYRPKRLNVAVVLNEVGTFVVFGLLTLSLGLLGFGAVNKYYSQQNELLTFELKIISAFEKTSRNSNRIYFELDGRRCGISVPSSPEVFSIIKDKDVLSHSYLFLACKKGLLNTYIIEDRDIIIRYAGV
jgi:hypothetical protein